MLGVNCVNEAAVVKLGEQVSFQALGQGVVPLKACGFKSFKVSLARSEKSANKNLGMMMAENLGKVEDYFAQISTSFADIRT